MSPGATLPRRMTAAWLRRQLTTSKAAVTALHAAYYLYTVPAATISPEPLSAETADFEVYLLAENGRIREACRVVEEDRRRARLSALQDEAEKLTGARVRLCRGPAEDDDPAEAERLAGIAGHLGYQDRTDVPGAGGYVSTVGCRCQVTNRDAYGVAFVPEGDGDLEDVKRFFDKTAADAYHAQLVRDRERLKERLAEIDEARQAAAAADLTTAEGAGASILTYCPTPESARAARHAWHVERAICDAEDGYEGPVTAPADMPRAAKPFQEVSRMGEEEETAR